MRTLEDATGSHHAGETKLSLEDSVSHVLGEARMVLPGVQTLFGFQMISSFHETFAQMGAMDKSMHWAALLLNWFRCLY